MYPTTVQYSRIPDIHTYECPATNLRVTFLSVYWFDAVLEIGALRAPRAWGHACLTLVLCALGPLYPCSRVLSRPRSLGFVLSALCAARVYPAPLTTLSNRQVAKYGFGAVD